jgi:uncharacterized protein (DUF58 family)
VTALLSPAFLAQLEAFQLSTRQHLPGRLAGPHRSPRHGSSLDFADFREYRPGDDPRLIDHLVWARLDQLVLRLYHGEEDLTVRILLDTSGSMGVDGKLDQARRVAAAIGYLSLARRDPVTIHRVPPSGAPLRFAGRAATPALFSHLGALEASGETAFAAGVVALLTHPGPPGLTVVVSDFLTRGWREALGRVPGGGSELLVVHVVARSDLEPTLVGDLEVVDRETGERVAVTATPEAVRAYRRRARAWADEVAGRARQLGAGYLQLLADDDIEARFVAAWRRAGVLR